LTTDWWQETGSESGLIYPATGDSAPTPIHPVWIHPGKRVSRSAFGIEARPRSPAGQQAGHRSSIILGIQARPRSMISTGRVLGVKPRSALASKPDLDPQLFNRLDRNQTEVCSGSKSRFWAIASSRARPWPNRALSGVNRVCLDCAPRPSRHAIG